MRNVLEDQAADSMFKAVEDAIAAHWTPQRAFRELQTCWQEALRQQAEQAQWEFEQIERAGR